MNFYCMDDFMSLAKEKLLKVAKFATLLGFGLYAGTASANQPNSIGLGIGGFGSSEYKDYDAGTKPIPILNVKGDFFYLEGLTAGAYLYADKGSQLSAVITYFGKSYDASESSNENMKQLDDRDSTALAGLSYKINITKFDSIKVNMLYDVLDETDGGYLIDVGYSARIPVVAGKLFVSPSAGVTWSNDKLVEHYYGVSAAESSRTEYSEYHPESSFSPYVGLNIGYKVTGNINLFARGQYSFLGSEVTDSPMVENSHTISGVLGFSVDF